MTDVLPDLESQLERYGAVLQEELAAPTAPVAVDRRDRQRSRLALAAAAVVFAVLVAALGVSRVHSTQSKATSNPTPTASTSTSTTVRRGISDPHQFDAEMRAIELVVGVRPGPLWTEVRAAPAAILRQPFSKPATPDLAQRTRFFVAPGPWDQVDAYIQTHAPPGYTSSGRGSTSTHGVATSHGFASSPVVLDLPPQFRQEWVEYETAPLPDGRIGVRADAYVVWVPSRPAAEVVPLGASAATVTATWGAGASGQHLSATRHDRATIDALARTLNGLLVADQGVGGCTMDVGLRLTLRFTGPGEDTVTTVSDPACGDTSFSRRGTAMPTLATGPVLLDQEAHALGTTLGALEDRAFAANTVPPPTTPTTR
jgi:hypothetical protein